METNDTLDEEQRHHSLKARIFTSSPYKFNKKGKLAVVGEYLVGKRIGKGAFSKVKLGVHWSTGEKVALKLINHARVSHEQNIRREVKLMELLDHPNIVKLHKVIEVPEKNVTCLVLEYVPGGELFEYIIRLGKLDEYNAARMFRQIISALEFCHSNSVIHRDLKPENILIDENENLKINDFGLGNTLKPAEYLKTFCGSPLYCSPEITLQHNYIGPEVDIWSLGVILYGMVTGYMPWDGDTEMEMLVNAVKGQFVIPHHVSKECAHIIKRMLTVNATKRATLAEIRESPWVNNGFDGPVPSCIKERPKLSGSPDEEIIDKLLGIGFTREEILRDLNEVDKTKMSYSMYYLMLDQKVKEQMERENEKRKLLEYPFARSTASLFEKEPTLEQMQERARSFSTLHAPPEKMERMKLSDVLSRLRHKHKKSSAVKKSTQDDSNSLMAPKTKLKTRNVSRYMKAINVELNLVGDATFKVLELENGNCALVMSKKTTPQVQEMVVKALTGMNVVFKPCKHLITFKCKKATDDGAVKFELEICKVREKEDLRVVKCTRIKGDNQIYQDIIRQNVLPHFRAANC